MIRAGLAAAAIAFALAAQNAHAQEPFYKGKRLTVLVNYAPGGSTDAEARVFARHIGRLLDGQPSVIIQNMEGAGGLVGAKYVGEIAPRDGTLAGYFTATAFLYALEPERFKVDFHTYEFVGIQPGTSINFVRTDVPPGMKEPADFVKAQGLMLGSLAPDSSKGVRLRLGFDLLGAALQIHQRLSLRRRGQARDRARRDQFLRRIAAELFLHHRAVAGEVRRRDPGLLRLRSTTARSSSCRNRRRARRSRAFHEFYQADQGRAAVRAVVGGLQEPDGGRRQHAAADRDAARRAAAGGHGAARRAHPAQHRQGLRGGFAGRRSASFRCGSPPPTTTRSRRAR